MKHGKDDNCQVRSSQSQQTWEPNTEPGEVLKQKKLCPLYEQINRNWNPTPSINNQSQKANQPQKNKKDSKLLFWSVNSINDFLF